MKTTHKQTKTTRLETAIACVLYYTGLKRIDYDAMIYEYGWKYAEDYGSLDLIYSDTFWNWFTNQFHIKTVALSWQLDRPEGLPETAIMLSIFKRIQVIKANDFYPQSAVHNVICQEIWEAKNKIEGGGKW
jgi:hypothetical protein